MNFGKQILKKYKLQDRVEAIQVLALKCLVITALIVGVIGFTTFFIKTPVIAKQSDKTASVEAVEENTKVKTMYFRCDSSLAKQRAEKTVTFECLN